MDNTFNEDFVTEVVTSQWPNKLTTAKQIADHLNDQNITTPSGLRWTAVGISQFAVNRLKLPRRRVAVQFRAVESRKQAKIKGTQPTAVVGLTDPGLNEVILKDIGQLLLSNMEHSAKLRILGLVIK